MKRLLLAVLLCSSSAHAEFLTGNQLMEHLKSENYWAQGYGTGYVIGAYDTGKGTLHCAPKGVTVGQIADIARAYLEANPTMRHYSGDSLVQIALSNAWPCGKKSNI